MQRRLTESVCVILDGSGLTARSIMVHAIQFVRRVLRHRLLAVRHVLLMLSLSMESVNAKVSGQVQIVQSLQIPVQIPVTPVQARLA
jgi:hypothetical protein